MSKIKMHFLYSLHITLFTDDTHDDGPPSVTVAVPVVVGSVVITAVVVVVVYCK